MSLRIAHAFIAYAGVFVLGGCTMAPDERHASTKSESEPSDSATPVEDAEEAGCGPAAPPDGAVVWSRDLGPIGIGRLGPASVATDRAGNVFHARPELGVAKLGPGGEALWQVPTGAVVAADRDGYAYVASAGQVTKLDPEGRPIWSRATGSEGAPESIAVSALLGPEGGAIVVSGAALGTMKLDARGDVAWSKPFGGHAAFGAGGAVFITGSFHGTIDLGQGPVASRGREDAFIVKLSPEGAPQWSHVLGDADLPIERPSGGFVTEPSDQRGRGIVEAANGDVLVTGLAIDSVKLFGEDIATPVSSEVGVLPLAYVARLDPSGAVLWTKREAAVRDVRGLASDGAGNVIVSGGLVGGAPPFARTWIEKLDPSGAPVWEHQESFGVGFGDATAVDRCGNIFLSVTASAEPAGKVHASLFKLRP